MTDLKKKKFLTDNQKVNSNSKCLTNSFSLSENPKQPWQGRTIPPLQHLRHKLMDRFIYRRYMRWHTNLLEL